MRMKLMNAVIHIEFLHAEASRRSRLGAAVQLALLRHPGFGLRSDELVSDALLRYLAEQLGVPVSAFRHYATRAQTRQDHAQELAGRLGLRLSRRGDLPLMMRHATDAAAATDKGAVIVAAVVDGIRAARIVLPSPDTIERVGLANVKELSAKPRFHLLPLSRFVVPSPA